jgi:hypothetical protein
LNLVAVQGGDEEATMSEHRRRADEPTGSISAIPPDVCLTLLMGGVVGWVAFIRPDGRQELMPVNFTVVEDSIYFRTSPSGPLSRLAARLDNVAFGVDGVDKSSGRGWNVTARGEAMRVTDPEVLHVVDASGLRQPWAGGERGEVVMIAIQEIDGRRVTRV